MNVIDRMIGLMIGLMKQLHLHLCQRIGRLFVKVTNLRMNRRALHYRISQPVPSAPPHHTACMMELRMDDGIVIQSDPKIGVYLVSCSRSSMMTDLTGELVARFKESITGS